ncbi:MAG: TonB-dependent receptor [Weeksellaceae bacterium]|nr:TonB-dependent receptor [Weeksellaceae bacterium]
MPEFLTRSGCLKLSLLFLGLGYLFAQQDSLELQDVKIMASPIPQSLMQMPAGVAQLGVANLQQNAGITLTHSANTVPGMFLQQGALNTQRLVLRGSGARSSYGTNRLKLYLNHIPLTAPDSESNPEEIDVDWLNAMTVFKGSFSTEFGSAMGGAVVFETPLQIPQSVRLIGRLGAFGYQKQSVMLHVAEGSFDMFAGLSHSTQDGFRQNSAYLRNSVLLMPSWRLSSHNIAATLLYNRQKAYIPSSLSLDDWRDAPDTSPANWRNAQGYEAYEKVTAGITHKYEKGDWLLRTSVFTQFRDSYEPRPFDILDEEQLGFGFRTHLNKDFTLANRASTWSIGAEFLADRLLRKGFENLYQQYPGGSLAGRAVYNTHNKRNNGHVFALLHSELIPDRLRLNTGISLSHARYRQSAVALEPKELDLGWVASPKIGLSWQVHPQSYVYANLSAGYSNPTSEETLDADSRLNVDIRPEQGLQLEIGHKVNFWQNRLTSNLSVYAMHVRNLLVAERIGEDQYMGRNAGKSQHLGLEWALQGNIPLAADWRIAPFASLTLQQHKFLDFIDRESDYSNNMIPGIPDVMAATGISVFWREGWRWRLNHHYVSGYYLNDENEGMTLPYNLLSTGVSFGSRLWDKLGVEVMLDVHNLLNVNYMASIVPNMQAFGTAAPRYFYPGTPRQWVVSVIVDAF